MDQRAPLAESARRAGLPVSQGTRGSGFLPKIVVPHSQARRAQRERQALLAFPEGSLGLFALGDVLHHADEVKRPALLIANQGHIYSRPYNVALLVKKTLLRGIRSDLPIEKFADCTEAGIAIIRMGDFQKRLAENLRPRIAE